MSAPQRLEEHNHHDHDHQDYDHDPAPARGQGGGKRDLLIALSITVIMMVVEVIGGILANSLALLSDAGHMLTDNLALLLSFFAMTFASMPATDRRTFGFYRLEILAALVNGIVLVLVSLYIMHEAYLRIIHPQPVAGTLMLIVAMIGLVANVIGAFVLKKHSHASLNIRGAYLHILGDALSSVGVVIGGVREAYHIHVWTITSGVYAMSGHVLIEDQLVSGSKDVLERIRVLLADKFKIEHSTIQLECDRCDLSSACSLPVNVKNSR